MTLSEVRTAVTDKLSPLGAHVICCTTNTIDGEQWWSVCFTFDESKVVKGFIICHLGSLSDGVYNMHTQGETPEELANNFYGIIQNGEYSF